MDTWLVWHGIWGDGAQETEKDFYEWLAEELIDNNYGSISPVRRRRRQNDGNPSPDAISNDGNPRSGINYHLTPTKKRRKGQENHLGQGICVECGLKTSKVCSGCRDEKPNEKEVFLCDSRSGRACFAEHLTKVHDN